MKFAPIIVSNYLRQKQMEEARKKQMEVEREKRKNQSDIIKVGNKYDHVKKDRGLPNSDCVMSFPFEWKIIKVGNQLELINYDGKRLLQARYDKIYIDGDEVTAVKGNREQRYSLKALRKIISE